MEDREELTQKVNYYLLFNFPAFAGKWIAFFSTVKVQNSEQRFCDYFVGVRRHWTEFSVDWCDGNRRQTSRWCSWYYCHFSRGEEWKLNFTLTRNLALVLNIYPPLKESERSPEQRCCRSIKCHHGCQFLRFQTIFIFEILLFFEFQFSIEMTLSFLFFGHWPSFQPIFGSRASYSWGSRIAFITRPSNIKKRSCRLFLTKLWALTWLLSSIKLNLTNFYQQADIKIWVLTGDKVGQCYQGIVHFHKINLTAD